jgi:hypothetical protein
VSDGDLLVLTPHWLRVVFDIRKKKKREKNMAERSWLVFKLIFTNSE